MTSEFTSAPPPWALIIDATLGLFRHAHCRAGCGWHDRCQSVRGDLSTMTWPLHDWANARPREVVFGLAV